MYPKRLILDDARQCGITVLGLDVNASAKEYVVEWLDPEPRSPPTRRRCPRPGSPTAPPGASGWRWPRSRGSTRPRSTASSPARPFDSLTDFWHRAQVSRPIVERLVLAGGFDSLYGIGAPDAGGGMRRRQRSPGATCCSRSPSSTVMPAPSSGRSGSQPAGRGLARRQVGRAADPGRADARPPPQQHRPAGPRAEAGRARAARRSPSRGSGRGPPPSPRRPRRRGRSTRSSSPSTSATSPARAGRPGCPR